MEKLVEVRDILRARDERFALQTRLRERWGCPVISFTMNIAGPIKRNALIDRAFWEGVSRIEQVLAARREAVLDSVCSLSFTGAEKLWAVRGDAEELKRQMTACEETDALGRLFDIDVIAPDGGHLSRPTERTCLLCSGPAKVCARSRAHSADELFARANQIIRSHFEEAFFSRVGQLAERALLHEACVTPKPGLVDAENSGAHTDMTLFTFLNSAVALRGFFENCARTGARTKDDTLESAFYRLRDLGIRAEAEMRRATGGVNAHKGAIFSVGLLCCAAGRIGENADTNAILEMSARLAEFSLNDLRKTVSFEDSRKGKEEPSAFSNKFARGEAIRAEKDGANASSDEYARGEAFRAEKDEASASADAGATFPRTGGETQFAAYGLTGARGEAAAGFPSVRNYALPALEAALANGKGLNDAALDALTRLMTRVSDSNVIRRAGMEGQKFVFECAREIDGLPDKTKALRALNGEFVKRNISPGGCADLLAVTLFLHFYNETR